MAPAFLSLPPEVRNEIYGYLFLDTYKVSLTHFDPKTFEVNWGGSHVQTRSKAKINPELRAYSPPGQPVALYTCSALGRTCQQIHYETNSYLYGKAAFQYFFFDKPAVLFKPKLMCTSAIQSCAFPGASLQKVQDLDIRIDYNYRVHPARVVESASDLITGASMLKRLHLLIKLPPYGVTYEPCKDWAKRIVHSTAVARSIEASKSLNYVQLTIRGDQSAGIDELDALAQAIVKAKGWTCVKKKQRLGPNATVFERA